MSKKKLKKGKLLIKHGDFSSAEKTLIHKLYSKSENKEELMQKIVSAFGAKKAVKILTNLYSKIEGMVSRDSEGNDNGTE